MSAEKKRTVRLDAGAAVSNKARGRGGRHLCLMKIKLPKPTPIPPNKQQCCKKSRILQNPHCNFFEKYFGALKHCDNFLQIKISGLGALQRTNIFWFLIPFPNSISNIKLSIYVFHHNHIKHLEFRQKFSTARRIFSSHLGVFICDETLYLVSDMLLQKLLIIYMENTKEINV